MSTNGFTVALAVFLLVFHPAIRAAEPTGAQSVDSGATKLDTNHKIGDRYTYRTMDLYSKMGNELHTITVTGISDGQVTYSEGGRISDLHGNDIKLDNGNQISGQQIFVPEYSVGKTWATKFLLRRYDGAQFTITYEFKVVGREKITVPAGTFDTYRVEGGGHIHQTSGLRYSACGERRSIFKMWIAPAQVRRIIASDYIQDGAYLGCPKYVAIRTELMSYQPGGQGGRTHVPETTGRTDFVPPSLNVEEPPNEGSRE